ncbi:MAG: filamentous hemagglutinin N-terminal domain-containing protein [Microcoleaceae cyanobacterium]
MRLPDLKFISLMGLALTSTVLPLTPGLAQIIPDGTLGSESSVVIPDQAIQGINSDRIDGGAIRGNNLFHSFQEFNIDEGRGVYFSNPDGIANILSRVTGENISNISGILGVLGNANLLLVNPNGIVFGPNARLDVNGSFFATSADGVVFNNEFEFAASNPDAPPLLTIDIPVGLNLRNDPGPITVQGEGLSQISFNRPIIVLDVLDEPRGIAVSPEETLGLVGGDVFIDGGLIKAESGRIELGAVDSNSFVSLTPTAAGLILGYDDTQSFRQLEITDRAGVIVSGAGGGSIQIVGQQLTASGGVEIQSFSLDDEPGGQVDIKATAIDLNGTDADTLAPTRVVTGTFGAGNAGNVLVEAGERLTIQNGAAIASDTSGIGSGGVLTVSAPDITVRGATPTELSQSGIFSATFGRGNTEAVIIQTDRLKIQNGGSIGGFVSTIDIGETGDTASVTIQASESVEISGVSANGRFPAAITTGTFSSGNAGNIDITTQQLTMQAQGTITAGVTGSGNAGNVTVNASEFIRLDGVEVASNTLLPFITSISTVTGGTGSAGDVILNTGQLLIRSGAAVAAGTQGGGNAGNVSINAVDRVELSGTTPEGASSISAGTTSRGNAGAITIQTGDLRLQDNSLVGVFATNAGDAGTVNISARDVVQLTGDVFNRGDINGIIATTFGTGDAGSVNINAAQLLIRDGAAVIASTQASGNAGTINVNTSEAVEIIGLSVGGGIQSLLSASTSGIGSAGTVTVSTRDLTLEGGGTIRVATTDQGKAGQISIVADSISLTGFGINDAATGDVFPSSLIASTQGSGSAGNIIAQTGQLSVADGAEIVSNTTQTGQAGTINVLATDINLTGTQPSIIVANTEGEGSAGNILLQTERFAADQNSRVEAGSSGSGNGGEIQLRGSESIILTDGSLLTAATEQTGNAGDISVETPNLTLNDQAEINVRALSTGVPGSVEIQASDVNLTGQASLNASSASGQGGNIRLGTDEIQLRRQSEILATGSTTGQTPEGNIEIDTNFLLLLENSRIVTDASNPTGGSNINISPLGNGELVIVQSLNSTISAAGNLTIDSSVTLDPVEVPDVAVVNPNALIAQDPCRLGQDSEFVITGRGGLPVSPRDLQSVSLGRVGFIDTVEDRVQESAIRDQLSDSEQSSPPSLPQQVISNQTVTSPTPHSPLPTPAQGWIRNEKGDVILVSYDSMGSNGQRLQYHPDLCQH